MGERKTDSMSAFPSPLRGLPTTEVNTREVLGTELVIQREPPYAVIIHNDDETTFEFVIHILETDFQLSGEMAEHIALTAHEEGSAVVVVRSKEQARTLIQLAQMHARNAGFPLKFSMEPAP